MPSYTTSRPATPHPHHYILPSAPSTPSRSGAPYGGIYAPSATYPSPHSPAIPYSPAVSNRSVQRNNESGYQSPGRLYSSAPSVSSMERNVRSSSPGPISPYARSPSPYYSRPQTPVLPTQNRLDNSSLPRSPSRSHSSKSKGRPSPLRLGSPAPFPTPHPLIKLPMHSPPPRGGPFDPYHRPHQDEESSSVADSDDSRRLSPNTVSAIEINRTAATLNVMIVNDNLVFKN